MSVWDDSNKIAESYPADNWRRIDPQQRAKFSCDGCTKRDGRGGFLHHQRKSRQLEFWQRQQRKYCSTELYGDQHRQFERCDFGRNRHWRRIFDCERRGSGDAVSESEYRGECAVRTVGRGLGERQRDDSEQRQRFELDRLVEWNRGHANCAAFDRLELGREYNVGCRLQRLPQLGEREFLCEDERFAGERSELRRLQRAERANLLLRCNLCGREWNGKRLFERSLRNHPVNDR